MSENAERAADSITAYLEFCGINSVQDQIAAIRRSYAVTWQCNLLASGRGWGLSVQDIAAGVDLALSLLLDQAQVIYDTQGADHALQAQ